MQNDNDLILRKTLIDLFTQYNFDIISNEMERAYTKEVVLAFIKNVPVDYDVEKVITELKEGIKVVNSKIDRDSIWGIIGVRSGYKDAIEMVNNGWTKE